MIRLANARTQTSVIYQTIVYSSKSVSLRKLAGVSLRAARVVMEGLLKRENPACFTLRRLAYPHFVWSHFNLSGSVSIQIFPLPHSLFQRIFISLFGGMVTAPAYARSS